MPVQVKCARTMAAFKDICYEAMRLLQQIMNDPDSVKILPVNLQWDNKIPGLSKLNAFVLVPPALYSEIKEHAWANCPINWTGFRGAPGIRAFTLLNTFRPSCELQDGTDYEVGGYEKQPGNKFYDKAEPSLNLELKYISRKVHLVNGRNYPLQSFVLNLHVKEVRQPRWEFRGPASSESERTQFSHAIRPNLNT